MEKFGGIRDKHPGSATLPWRGVERESKLAVSVSFNNCPK
jgi:hypothetical protein